MENKYLVKKEDRASLSNVLNEMFYEEKMTLQELRFFLVYLSKINPKEPDKTEVTFTLEDYAKLLGVELNEAAINKTARKLMRYIVSVRPKELDESDEYDMGVENVQLFSKSKLLRRKLDGKWYLTFSCHEEIKKHLFELKSEYTSMQIWNIINLSNFQDARMYMLLKQYKTIGERTIPLDELKKMLGIEIDAYPEYKVFSRDVLKKCQKSLKEKTDITFEFVSLGRPAKAIRFKIYNNEKYIYPEFLSEENEIDMQESDQLPGQMDIYDYPEALPEADPDLKQIEPEEPDEMESRYDLWSDACRGEFSREQIEELSLLAGDHVEYQIGYPEKHDLDIYHYLQRKYKSLNARPKAEVKNRYGLMKWLVENDR